MKIFSLLLLIIFPLSGFSGGEREHHLYYGPSYPLMSPSIYGNQDRDQLFFSELTPYFDQRPQHLHLYLKDQLFSNMSCPNGYYNLHKNYIKYLFRLFYLSQLVDLSDEFSCLPSFEEIFSSCQTSSHQMEQLQNKIRGYRLIRRERNFLPVQKELCPLINLEVKTLCEERDEIFGLSEIKEASELIGLSSAISVMNEGGMALSCIRRFILDHQSKEKKSGLFPTISTLLNKKSGGRSDSSRGTLFTLGTASGGAVDRTLMVKIPVVSVIEITPTPIPIPEPILDQVPVPVEVVHHKELKDDFKEKSVPPRGGLSDSYFYKCYKWLLASNVDEFILLTDELIKDRPLGEARISKLNEKVKSYLTREALVEMKRFDGLGTKKEPLSLNLLKYLLTVSNHQALFNISAVLGKRFYIKNDVDSFVAPVLVEFSNDKNTGNRWQIKLIKESPPKEDTKKEKKKGRR